MELRFFSHLKSHVYQVHCSLIYSACNSQLNAKANSSIEFAIKENDTFESRDHDKMIDIERMSS